MPTALGVRDQSTDEGISLEYGRGGGIRPQYAHGSSRNLQPDRAFEAKATQMEGAALRGGGKNCVRNLLTGVGLVSPWMSQLFLSLAHNGQICQIRICLGCDLDLSGL